MKYLINFAVLSVVTIVGCTNTEQEHANNESQTLLDDSYWEKTFQGEPDGREITSFEQEVYDYMEMQFQFYDVSQDNKWEAIERQRVIDNRPGRMPSKKLCGMYDDWLEQEDKNTLIVFKKAATKYDLTIEQICDIWIMPLRRSHSEKDIKGLVKAMVDGLNEYEQQ